MEETNGLQIVNMVSLQPKTERLLNMPINIITPSTCKDDDKPDDKPLLKLIKCLFSIIENSPSTVLTNAELIHILKVEFNINVTQTHHLEVEIYMNVLKKFLRMWPRWDTVYLSMQKAKYNPKIDVEQKLYKEYISLKSYLQNMLDMSREGAKQAVSKQDITRTHLKITCSQEKLYSMFLQQPNDQQSILSYSPQQPEKIVIKTLQLSSILNWPNTTVTVDTKNFKFQYENICEMKHTLINRKLMKPNHPSEIKKNVLQANRSKKVLEWNYLNTVKTAIEQVRSDDLLKRHLLQRIEADLTTVNPATTTKTYKYYLHSHPYVRYYRNPLKENRDDNLSDQYDLVLQEYLSFAVSFFISPCRTTNDANWINITCKPCQLEFEPTNNQNVESLMQHFSEYHSVESKKDLTCVSCNIGIPFETLASARWDHVCIEPLVVVNK